MSIHWHDDPRGRWAALEKEGRRFLILFDPTLGFYRLQNDTGQCYGRFYPRETTELTDEDLYTYLSSRHYTFCESDATPKKGTTVRYRLDRLDVYEVEAIVPFKVYLRTEAVSAAHAEAAFVAQLLEAAHEQFSPGGGGDLEATLVPTAEVEVVATLETERMQVPQE